jgi:fido (protein-threonine AMPylation protein)
MKFRPELPVVVQGKIFQVILAKSGNGGSIEEIDNSLEIYIPRRTLQRRLAEMQKIGWIFAKGEARATRYYAHSPENEALRDSVNETAEATPKKDRDKTVSYHRRFLEGYEPQQPGYLSAEDIEKLTTIGSRENPGSSTGDFTKKIFPRFLADFAYNSCRLEGSYYSQSETQQLLQSGEAPVDKTIHETQMILNHRKSLEFIVFEEEELALNRHVLTNLHALLSDNLLADPASYGSLRTMPFKLEESSYTPPESSRLIEEMFELIIAKATQIDNPFEQSFFLMVHLSYLHPFDNTNNQVTRVAMNIPFIKNNLSPVSFAGSTADMYHQALLQLYEFNRVELLRVFFIATYKRSAQLYADFQSAPDLAALFRLNYQDRIRKLVARIVTGSFARDEAAVLIKEKSLDIEEKDRIKFIEYVNTELCCLHEGNIARFGIRPGEIENWKAGK